VEEEEEKEEENIYVGDIDNLSCSDEDSDNGMQLSAVAVESDLSSDESENAIDQDPFMLNPEQSGTVTYEVVEGGTKRGKPMLVDSDGYHYNVRRKTQKATYWQCTLRGLEQYCHVSVVEKWNDCGKVFEKSGTHYHSAEPKSVVGVKIKAKVKEMALNQVFTSASDIVEQVQLMYHHPGDTANLLSRENLTRAANRVRQRARPVDPHDLNFDYVENFVGRDFLQKDIRLDGQMRHMLFANKQMLRLLGKCRTWYIDATFRVVSKPFKQLFSIHGFAQASKGGKQYVKQVPLIFVLMSGKKTSDYQAVFEGILALFETPPRVRECVMDFEGAIWRAMNNVFPNVQRHGCHFHWSQAIWRKTQSLGLAELYQNNLAVKKYIRRLMALPFLPAIRIKPIFTKLEEKAHSESLMKLTTYIRKTWIESKAFGPATWSAYMRPVRTNNDLEGYHHRLNRRARNGNLPFYELVKRLHNEANICELDLTLIKDGNLAKRQRKQFRRCAAKIWGYWTEHYDKKRTDFDLLKACAHVYAPSVDVARLEEEPSNLNA